MCGFIITDSIFDIFLDIFIFVGGKTLIILSDSFSLLLIQYILYLIGEDFKRGAKFYLKISESIYSFVNEISNLKQN